MTLILTPAQKNHRFSVLWTVLFTCIGLPLLGIIALVTFNLIYIKWEESHDIPFSAEQWHQGSRQKLYSTLALQIDAPRIKMYRDLISKKIILGKTQQEIVGMLGEPDNFPFRAPWHFNYWLGLQRGPMKMDSAWLAVRFDDQGSAVEIRMLQD